MKILALSALMVLSSFFASAQTSATAQNTVNVTIANSITIATVDYPEQNITVASVTDFTSGVTTTNASTFTVASNRLYNVSVVPAANAFTPTNTTGSLPVSALQVRKTGSGSFTAFSNTTTAIPILTGGARGAATTFSVDYKAAPGLTNDYPTDTYKIVLTYTATQY
jgi:hypothetical protein